MRNHFLIATVVLIASLSHAVIVDIPFDAQIDIGDGPAITTVTGTLLEFLEEGGEGFARSHLVDGWNVGAIQVDLMKTSYGVVDLSGPGLVLSFTCRYFQDDAGGTRTPYGDAPIGVYVTDTEARHYGLGWLYQTAGGAGDPPHPTWTTVTVPLDFTQPGEWPTTEGFDPSLVYRIRFMSTNWGAGDPPGDFIDVKNFQIVPEPTTLSLLGLAGLALLRRRKK